MSDFTLDTSGDVWTPHGQLANTYWEDLSPFEQGYTRAGLEELAKRLRKAGWSDYHISQHVRFDRLAPETLAAIRKDCAIAAMRYPAWGMRALQGRTFWAERQRGFEPTQSLNAGWLKATFPPLTVTHGDDGRVYLREAS